MAHGQWTEVETRSVLASKRSGLSVEKFARSRGLVPQRRLRGQDGTQSAGRWLAGVDRKLSGESPLVGGTRFTAGNIGGQVRILIENAR
jgi:hypothetical protein